MNDEVAFAELAAMYPFAALRGQRVTRLEGAELGQFELDTRTASMLGTENIGVLAGDCGNLPWMAYRLWRFVGDHTSQTWVVAAATNDSLDELIRLTCEQFGVSCSRQSPGHWRYESLLFTTPEGLTGVVEDRAFAARVPAIILVDPTCMVYQARRGHGRWRGKDRPQHIADYRAAVCDRGWSPPFFVWTQRPAKSISSLQMESAFCVSGWWFLDGRSLRTGPPPGRSGLLTGSLALCL